MTGLHRLYLPSYSPTYFPFSLTHSLDPHPPSKRKKRGQKKKRKWHQKTGPRSPTSTKPASPCPSQPSSTRSQPGGQPGLFYPYPSTTTISPKAIETFHMPTLLDPLIDAPGGSYPSWDGGAARVMRGGRRRGFWPMWDRRTCGMGC